MNYHAPMQFHFKPKKGWMNDPNGLVYFQGYYHAFFQHAPHFEKPWNEPMTWGHARTKDFIEWEELPVALLPDMPYDKDGCWSGTATVKDDILYLVYTSVNKEKEQEQTVSIAYSEDGVHFQKYANNPVIKNFPNEGSKDFRDPAIMRSGEDYYLVMASGNPEEQKGRLLLYKGNGLFDWEYLGVMCEWDGMKYCECPSFMPHGDGYLLTTSLVECNDDKHFYAIYGQFDGKTFTPEITSELQMGPDQYAGQAFADHMGRSILITWLPGWHYAHFTDVSIGCLSVPTELKVQDGKILAYPVQECQPFLKDADPLVQVTENGFIMKRTEKENVICNKKIRNIKILRDEYMLEIFINDGEFVYAAVIC